MKLFFAMLLATSGGIVLANWAEDYFQDRGDLNPKLVAFLLWVAWASLVYMIAWP